MEEKSPGRLQYYQSQAHLGGRPTACLITRRAINLGTSRRGARLFSRLRDSFTSKQGQSGREGQEGTESESFSPGTMLLQGDQ